jgi:hypothetical protein
MWLFIEVGQPGAHRAFTGWLASSPSGVTGSATLAVK